MKYKIYFQDLYAERNQGHVAEHDINYYDDWEIVNFIGAEHSYKQPDIFNLNTARKFLIIYNMTRSNTLTNVNQFKFNILEI